MGRPVLVPNCRNDRPSMARAYYSHLKNSLEPLAALGCKCVSTLLQINAQDYCGAVFVSESMSARAHDRGGVNRKGERIIMQGWSGFTLGLLLPPPLGPHPIETETANPRESEIAPNADISLSASKLTGSGHRRLQQPWRARSSGNTGSRPRLSVGHGVADVFWSVDLGNIR